MVWTAWEKQTIKQSLCHLLIKKVTDHLFVVWNSFNMENENIQIQATFLIPNVWTSSNSKNGSTHYKSDTIL